MHCFATSCVLASLFILACGCTSGTQPPRMIDNLEEARVTEFQMRVLTTDYARHFAGTVETASLEIANRTDDPAIRRAGLVWKSNAISACQSAMLKADPFAAMLDMWALTEQMARFLDSGPGQGLFGTWQSIAIDASRGLEEHVTGLAKSVSGERDVAEMQRTVEGWVGEHPIQSLQFVRQYPQDLVLRVEGGGRLGALAAVESLEERLHIYSQFLPVFVELLPKQIRWQSRLVIEDYVSRREVENAESVLDAIGVGVAGVHQELDELPDLVGEQREAAIEAVRTELDRLVMGIDEQRVATIGLIDALRIETLDVLRQERRIVLDAIEELRGETLRELPGVIRESVEETIPAIQALADRLFWRAAILCGGLGALLLLGFLVLQIAKRPMVAEGER